MLVYILIFVFTTFFWIAAQQLKPKSELAFYICSFAAIFILSFFAGCRDVTIGTDVLFYEQNVHDIVIYADHSSQWQEAREDIEYVFYIINYVSLLFGDHIGYALFLIQFIQSVIVFIAFKRYMDRVPLWLMMLAYELIFYNLTLNLMRQGLAVAYVLWAFKYFERKSFWKFLLAIVVGCFIHKSCAAVAVIMFAIYWVMCKDEDRQYKWLWMSAFLAVGAFFLFGPVLSMIAQIESLSKFSAYGSNSAFETGLNTIGIATRLLFVVGVIYVYKYSDKRIANTMLFILVADLFSLSLGLYTYYTSRLAMYFYIIEIPYMFILLDNDKVMWRTRLCMKAIVIVLLTFSWYWLNVYHGENATCPYTSEIIGIE